MREWIYYYYNKVHGHRHSENNETAKHKTWSIPCAKVAKNTTDHIIRGLEANIEIVRISTHTHTTYTHIHTHIYIYTPKLLTFGDQISSRNTRGYQMLPLKKMQKGNQSRCLTSLLLSLLVGISTGDHLREKCC